LALIERLSDALYVLNGEWEFTYLNQATEDLFGEDRKKLLNSNIWEQFPEAMETPFYEHYHEALADGEPRTIEEPFEPWNKWYRAYIYPSENGLTIISKEITEEKQQELELDRNRELVNHVEKLTQIGGWEVDVETGRQRWTDGTYRIHDLDPAGDYDPTVEDGIEFYHPEDQETIRQAVEQCISDGISYEDELRLVTAEGRDRWVRTLGVPVRESGEITAVRGAIQDVTEQKHREQELRTTDRRLDLALQQARAGIWEWDLETDDLYWSDELLGLLGLSSGMFDGSIDAFEERLHPDDSERTEAAMEKAIDTGEPYRVEQRIETEDGDYRWLDVRGQFVDDEMRMVGVAFDITERKQQEQRLQRQNERLDTFADVVSHDLRNPLNVAQGRLELAREDCDSEHLGSVERALVRMDDLIQNLLTLAREGTHVIELETVELAELSEQCWQNIETADAAIRTDVDRRIQADRSRLQQLLENLIRNAVEHGGDDVTVTVGGLANGFYLEDTGPGIPEDERKEVFDVGYSTTEDGTGLGLNIVEQIAEAHGWTVDVTDGSAGGVRFEITDVQTAE
jgi:PAS domain S-box-containing protein